VSHDAGRPEPPSVPEFNPRFYDEDARQKLAAGADASLGTVTTQAHVAALKDALERAHLQRVLPLSGRERVLDLGGGAGRIAFALAPHVASVLLVDGSSVQIEAARARALREGHGNVTAIVDSILAPRPEGPFDVVIMFGVAAHLGEDELPALARRLADVVAPGGRLVLKEPVSTDGETREDVRRDAGGQVVYRSTFRPRETYPARLAGTFALEHQAPTCAHLIPFFLGGTESAAAASEAPWAARWVERAAPWLVRADPTLQAIERRLRGSPGAALLAPIPVLQDLYVFRRRSPRLAVAEPELSVVFIAYNEEECLAPVVWEMIDALDAAGPDFELVLVDDGSTDATAARMTELAAADPRVRLSPNPRNLGIGGALRNGFDAARGRFVTWAPGDGQISPESVLELYRRRHEAPMLTTVYRSRDDAWYRQVISQSLNQMIRLRTGQVAKSGGNYLFARSVWQRHAPRDDDSMMISTAFRKNLRDAGETIVEVEIDARARVAGHSKVLNPSTILRTLRATLQMGKSAP
jgi:SAM-dependent methyltransferase